jgi:hypothetical protein
VAGRLGLREALPGQPSLVALHRLLTQWFGHDVAPLTEECDGSGVPVVLHEVARVVLGHRSSATLAWTDAGQRLDDGDVIVNRHGSKTYWCAPGSVGNPVLCLGYKGSVHELAARVDDHLLDAFLNEARLSAPVCLQGVADSVDDAIAFLTPYRKVVPGGADESGTYAGDDIFVNYQAPIGTLWPKPRFWIFGRGRSAVEAARTEVLTAWHWSALDGIYEPQSDHVLSASSPLFEVDDGARSGVPLLEALRDPDAGAAIQRFLQAWYGLVLPSGTARAPGRRGLDVLTALDELNQTHPVTGSRGELRIPRAAEAGEGRVFFVTEGGSTASWRDDTSDPEVFVWDPPNPAAQAAGVTLSEFLLSAVVGAAISTAPCHAMTSIYEADAAERALADLTLVRAQTRGTAALYANDRVIVQARFGAHSDSLRVGAHSRDAIARTSLRHLGGWSWFYGDPPSPPSEISLRQP